MYHILEEICHNYILFCHEICHDKFKIMFWIMSLRL